MRQKFGTLNSDEKAITVEKRNTANTTPNTQHNQPSTHQTMMINKARPCWCHITGNFKSSTCSILLVIPSVLILLLFNVSCNCLVPAVYGRHAFECNWMHNTCIQIIAELFDIHAHTIIHKHLFSHSFLLPTTIYNSSNRSRSAAWINSVYMHASLIFVSLSQ